MFFLCSAAQSGLSPFTLFEARSAGRRVGVIFRGHHALGPLRLKRAGEGERLDLRAAEGAQAEKTSEDQLTFLVG
jgi:hypothetical protein